MLGEDWCFLDSASFCCPYFVPRIVKYCPYFITKNVNFCPYFFTITISHIKSVNGIKFLKSSIEI